MSIDIPEQLKSLNHFLSIRDLGTGVLGALIDVSILRKRQFQKGELQSSFPGKVLAMIFQKSSLRTRLGFEVAMAQLGGHAVNLDDHQVGISRREKTGDVARVVSSMCDVIMARIYTHHTVIELAANSRVPVINGLSDWAHPCQALSDLMTIKEHFGELRGLKLAYVGDANNVARSLLNATVEMSMNFACASPVGYQLDDGLVAWARSVADKSDASVTITDAPEEAASDADIVYTDVWTSMGQETERAEREKAFAGFQINAELMKVARPQAVVMHCLPANRNMEITDDMVDGCQSLIFQQAENRLHSQRALLEVLLGRVARD